MALASLRAAKFRSFLTMLGIIIGVMSVVTIVSLGEGVRRQVVDQINQLGSDIISVQSGNLVTRDENGKITGYNITESFGGSTLTEKDLETIQKVDTVAAVAPTVLIAGTISAGDVRDYPGSIVATTPDMPTILNQTLAAGDFFGEKDKTRNVAVISADVGQKLFNDPLPIGRVFRIRGNEFVVLGVLNQFKRNPLNFGVDFNNAIFIPLATGKQISAGNAQIREITIKAKEDLTTATVKKIDAALLANHGGERDFTVLEQDEFLGISDQIFTLLTGLVAAIAGLSLVVGGIGVMNIMLVSVSERTKEIGIRKAIGATNRQISSQFMIEAIVLSVIGGVIGVILSIFAGLIIRSFTDIKPVIDLTIILIATGVSSIVGIIFGLTPALKAARKDPITSLRNE